MFEMLVLGDLETVPPIVVSERIPDSTHHEIFPSGSVPWHRQMKLPTLGERRGSGGSLEIDAGPFRRGEMRFRAAGSARNPIPEDPSTRIRGTQVTRRVRVPGKPDGAVCQVPIEGPSTNI